MSTEISRLEVKIANKRIKLTAAFANNLAVGSLVGGLVGPIMGGHSESLPAALSLFAAAGLLHYLGRQTLRDLKSEE